MNDQPHGARPPQPPQQASSAGGTNWKLWAGLVLLVLLMIFVAQNSQDAEVRFLFMEWTGPLIFTLAITAALGALFGWLFPRVRRSRRDD